MNHVQFHPGLAMAKFLWRDGAERQCELAPEAARWPHGFRCPGCGDSWLTSFERQRRGNWQCCSCQHQNTCTSGTIFEATKPPLSLWFLAVHLQTQSSNNVLALEWRRHLVMSYPAVWRPKYKLMQVMADREQKLVLIGRAENDDAYMGSEHPGTPERGTINKALFIAAEQTTPSSRPGNVSFKAMRFTKEGIRNWTNRTLHPDALVYRDALPTETYGLTAQLGPYHAIQTGTGRVALPNPEFNNVNTVLGNLEAAILGTFHAIDFAKYANRYIEEAQYCFNRRFDLSAVLRRLIRVAATTSPYPMRILGLAEGQF